MAGWMLKLYIFAMVMSVLMEMAGVYHMMQVLKIDASSSAVGVGGADRKKNLQRFVAFAVLGPLGSALALGVAISLDGGWLMVLALSFTIMQAVSASYMAVNIVEPPQRADNVTTLKRTG